MKLISTLKSYWDLKQNMKSAGVQASIKVSKSQSPQSLDTEGHLVVQLLDAVNGKLLQYRKYDIRTDRWATYVYIVRPDESLAEAMATILVLTGEKS